MQAMAHAQAAAGSASLQGDAYPFSTLAVWRDKLQADLGTAGSVGGPEYKTRLLLEQGKDVEQAVLGCLKDALFDLHEGVAWGLLSPEFEAAQRQQLLNAAANELNTDKQLVVQLAREHGVLDEYAAQVQRPINRTLADYERVGELKFGLLVWRANLRRDASLARGAASVPSSPIKAASAGDGGDPLAMELLVRRAYMEALRLIQRCANHSMQWWSAQQSGNAPDGGSRQRLHQAALERVQNSLLELAETFGLGREALDRLFQELPDPEAVQNQEELEADPEGEGSSPGGGAGGSPASQGGSQASSSSALGF